MCAGGSKCAPGVGQPHILTLLRYRGMTARYAGVIARYRGMVPRYRGTVARCAGGVPRRANGPSFVPSEPRTVRWSHPTVPWTDSTVPCDDCSAPRNHRSVPRNHRQECPVRRAMRLFRRRVPGDSVCVAGDGRDLAGRTHHPFSGRLHGAPTYGHPLFFTGGKDLPCACEVLLASAGLSPLTPQHHAADGCGPDGRWRTS